MNEQTSSQNVQDSKNEAAQNLKCVELPVSFGEALDKLSILAIKRKRLQEEDVRHAHATFEYKQLKARLGEAGVDPIDLLEYPALMRINDTLWELEDIIRAHVDGPADLRTMSELVTAMCKVPAVNDKRCKIKDEINVKLGSSIREVKSYDSFRI